MRKHYLLLAHDQPDHVLRLIERLAGRGTTFWVHLDARADIELWTAIRERRDVVMAAKRHRCVWGTWSMVEAQLALVRDCLASTKAGYLIMLSGQSYPIKSSAHIDQYLEAHSDLVHMDLWALESRWPDNYRDRLDYFCIPMSEDKGNLRLLRPRQEMNARELIGWTRRLVKEVGLRQAGEVLRIIGRPRPDVRERIVGGSQWWAMPWDTAERMMEHHAKHPEVGDFLRWSQFPDESFFQSLLVDMDESLRARVAPTLTYVDWTEGDWDLPRALGMNDVGTLLALPAHLLLARKFLLPNGELAADELDRTLERSEGA